MASRPRISVSIWEKDLGMGHILAEAKKLAQIPFVTVGVQGDTALNRKKQKIFIEGRPVIEDADITVVDVAQIHEFGSETVPERSFIRSTMDAKGKEFSLFAAALANKILSPETKMKTEQALGLLGEKIQSAIQGRFTDGDNGWAPLKYRDGTPLVDTGQLRRSIRWVRHMK